MIVQKFLGFISLAILLQFGNCFYEYCNHTFNVLANKKIIIQSPYYEHNQKYPTGSSCLYHIRAPIDYVINSVCTITLDANPSYCTTEFFYVHSDGDTSENLFGSNYYCGNGVVRETSLFNRLTAAYTSTSNTPGVGGKFSCEFSAVPQTSCDCGWTVTSKITGGVDAGQNEFPSIVKVVMGPERFCGGIIISHKNILTAAHCVSKFTPNQLYIVFGQHYTQSGAYNKYYGKAYVAAIKVHEYYNEQTNQNDIAILTTTDYIEWSRGVGPVCLPWLYEAATLANQPVDIAGWGALQFSGQLATVLQKATVNVITKSNCNQFFPSVSESQVCTMSPPKDSCQQDSGGPLYYRQTGTGKQFLMGIISYGSLCGSKNPSVNTRVTYYLQWIRANSIGAECRKT